MRFQQLETVAERIVHVDAVVTFKRPVITDRHARSTELFDECRKILHLQGRVGLAGRAEQVLNAEVNLDGVAFEPTPSTALKVRWLGHSRQPEQALVERLRFGLAAGRHRQLHVINRDNPHDTEPPGRPTPLAEPLRTLGDAGDVPEASCQ